MVACLLFFVLHWQGSLFFQSFFLHRYSAHQQFTMSKAWERLFHLMTWVMQGSTYMPPRAYAILHRMHHAWSDTPRDPHSPAHHDGPISMMWSTAKIYHGIRTGKVRPEAHFDGGYPEWPLLDQGLHGWGPGIAWGTLYTLFYLQFATTPWLYLLLPIHYLMGPVHGAIVNWCGHRYGYRNYETADGSRNTLCLDVVTGGRAPAEQPPPRDPASELRHTVVRDRSDLAGHPHPRRAGDHRSPRVTSANNLHERAARGNSRCLDATAGPTLS